MTVFPSTTLYHKSLAKAPFHNPIGAFRRKAVYNNDYYEPHTRFFNMLKKEYNVNLYSAKMYKIKITLDYPDFEISREVLVPSFLTFNNMHMVIQNCFNWQNYHMYEFIVEKDDEIQLLIASQESIAEYEGELFNYEILCDKECRLEDILEKEKRMLYIYDMGDYWCHTIELEEVTDIIDKLKPTCLKVTGKAPPEDCGGADGYRELIESIENGDQEMIEWVRSMKWDEPNERIINASLSFRIY